MLMAHTAMQITPMTLVSNSLNSSSFCWRGDWTSSVFSMVSLILPISVFWPMPTTTPLAWPVVQLVPLNMVLRLPCRLSGSGMASITLLTGSLSPVRSFWSMRKVMVWIFTTRMSAGTVLPTATVTMSPGTRSSALMVFSSPDLVTTAVSGSNCFKASMAFSALVSCKTPTMALAMRIKKMTRGSKKAVSCSSPSSKMARTNEMMAAVRRIRTRGSSNCSRTSFQKGVASLEVRQFLPYFCWRKTASSSDRPCSIETSKSRRTFSTGWAQELSMMGCEGVRCVMGNAV
mmetsp:Transcript_38620/g.64132  ORF Transcript_38620/g.64132 Transcript_38620/m.64132 type:complete len:288 (-) Transcript_38620:9-872(-)